MGELVTIIITVYNAEFYLERCLKSVAAQTYINIQIVLIDDGSMDRSPEICDTYCRMDKRFICVHCRNGGTSKAKNKGLALVKGKYVIFIDSDDYLEPDALSFLMEKFEKSEHTQLVVSNYNVVNMGKIEHRFQAGLKGEVLRNTYDRLFFNTYHNFFVGVVWNKLYKTSIIFENNLEFDEQVSLCEDTIFNLNYLRYCERISICSKHIYNYEQHNPHSLLRKERPKGERWYCSNKLYEQVVTYFNFVGYYEEYKSEISNFLILPLKRELSEIVQSNSKDIKRAYDEVKRLAEQKTLSNILPISRPKDSLSKLCVLTLKYKKYYFIILVLKCNLFLKSKCKLVHHLLKARLG